MRSTRSVSLPTLTLEIPATRGWPQLRHNLVHDLAALNKTEMLLWEDWGMPDPRTAPGPGELPVLDELATLTGQPSPPLAGPFVGSPPPGVRGTGHRDHIQPRPGLCPGGRERQHGGPGSQLTGASAEPTCGGAGPSAPEPACSEAKTHRTGIPFVRVEPSLAGSWGQ